jgi:hypothetical protein
MMIWLSHVDRICEVRNVHKILVRKSERKIQLERDRPRRRCEDNIKMTLKEI